MTRVLRWASGGLGGLAAAYGGWLMLGLGWGHLLGALAWLIGAVVLHDAVFAPLGLAVSYVALRTVPRHRLAPVVVILVILVPVTLAGTPELGRFGGRVDNPTLLDRPYWLGWSVMVTAVVVCVLLGAVVSARLARRKSRIIGGSRGRC